jgi:DNA polymerase III alpha subunit
MSDIIPLFYDHSSQKSILTFWKESECTPESPQSIISLCKEAKLKQCVAISKNFHTYIEAWKNCKDAEIQLIFGLEVIMCQDSKIHTDESIKNEHKIIIFIKNSDGYKDLIKIYTKWKTTIDNKYYIFRFDFEQLKELWTDNLILAIPFFDSFIHKNTLQNAQIIPDFPTNPIILREIDTGIPYEFFLNKALDRYNENKQFKEIKTKTIYYKNKKDVKAWQIYRSIQDRTTFSAPKMDFCASDTFCFESYLEIIK